MIRLIFAIVCGLIYGLIMGAPLGISHAQAAPARQQPAPVHLNEQVVVNDAMVRLGDIFRNVAENADTPVGYAPAPGKRASFDARWLLAVARAYRVNWRPSSRYDRIIVERASQIVLGGDIEDEVSAALSATELGPDIRVRLSQRRLEVHIPPDFDPTILVEDLMHDPRTNRFSATVVISPDSDSPLRKRISGHVNRLVEVPVLANSMSRGEVIGKDDVQWIKVSAERIGRNVVTTAAALVGKTPKRQLRGGVMLRVGEVRRPILVPKGSLVTMVLATPVMRITTQGRALEHGARGDIVRVRNTRSRKVVDAVVISANVVKVSPTLTVVSN